MRRWSWKHFAWEEVEPRPAIIQQEEPLSEMGLNVALAVDAKDQVWRAVMQLIHTAEANANENAAASMDPPGILAGYVGGASHLRLLRDELISRREAGIHELGERTRIAQAIRAEELKQEQVK